MKKDLTINVLWLTVAQVFFGISMLLSFIANFVGFGLFMWAMIVATLIYEMEYIWVSTKCSK